MGRSKCIPKGIFVYKLESFTCGTRKMLPWVSEGFICECVCVYVCVTSNPPSKYIHTYIHTYIRMRKKAEVEDEEGKKNNKNL